jgi:hypothetical protein
MQPWDETIYTTELAGWIQSGPNCDEDIYSYLAPCPYSKCRTGENSDIVLQDTCRADSKLCMWRLESTAAQILTAVNTGLSCS